jgi:hypothetical protein
MRKVNPDALAKLSSVSRRSHTTYPTALPASEQPIDHSILVLRKTSDK